MRKIKFFAVCLVAFAIVSFDVFSANRSFKITVPKTYTFVYKEDSKKDIAEKLNMSEKELDGFFSENNIEFLALNGDNTEQIRVCVYEDDFSKSVMDFSGLSADDLKVFADKMVEGTELGYSVCSNEGINYIKLSEMLSDSGGRFTATQFITVSGGKVYNISFNNGGSLFKNEFSDVLDSFEISNTGAGSKTPALITVIIAVGISVLAVIITLMIFGIVKDKKQEMQDKEKEG